MRVPGLGEECAFLDRAEPPPTRLRASISRASVMQRQNAIEAQQARGEHAGRRVGASGWTISTSVPVTARLSSRSAGIALWPGPWRQAATVFSDNFESGLAGTWSKSGGTWAVGHRWQPGAPADQQRQRPGPRVQRLDQLDGLLVAGRGQAGQLRRRRLRRHRRPGQQRHHLLPAGAARRRRRTQLQAVNSGADHGARLVVAVDRPPVPGTRCASMSPVRPSRDSSTVPRSPRGRAARSAPAGSACRHSRPRPTSTT